MTPPSDDGPLPRALRQHCRVTPEPNPDFRAAVWARIEARRRAPATWSAWLRANLRRTAALSVAAIALAGVSGGVLARIQAGQEREALVQRYLASIDPHRQIHAGHR
jgi:hypothetical protein